MHNVVIDGGVADMAIFRASKASSLWIRKASLKESDFYGAQLRDSAFLNSDLTGANFTSARIQGLSLHGSMLDSIRGAQSFASSDVCIAKDQILSLGVAVLAGMGVRADCEAPDGGQRGA